MIKMAIIKILLMNLEEDIDPQVERNHNANKKNNDSKVRKGSPSLNAEKENSSSLDTAE